jgi:hypothetical protein
MAEPTYAKRSGEITVVRVSWRRELEIMATMAESLERLDQPARDRVLRWLRDKYLSWRAAGGRRVSPRTVPPVMPVTEKDLERFVKDAARTFGWRRYHTHRSDFSPAGWPDEALCRPPRLILAELKSEKAPTSPAQEEWLSDLRRVEVIEVHLWRPKDCDAIARIMR